MAYYTGLMERIVSVSQQCDKVVAVAVIGSQARKENRADEYSDLDLIMVVTDSEDFLSSDDWFRQLGTVQVSFCENTLAGQKEKRILFDDGAVSIPCYRGITGYGLLVSPPCGCIYVGLGYREHAQAAIV